ncbi:MAG: hypothetical protein GVY18_09105, partial [Bacteroidetes bacterium]|jgi:hypothetical protein|nr:hypothetical protein [Bacteroidota bacterium]
MTTSTRSILSPVFALIFAMTLLMGGCATSLTGPDAVPSDDETVQARPFTPEQADHAGEGGDNGGGSTTPGAGHNTAEDE